MSSAILVGVLVAGGVFLILQRGLIRMAFGIVMIGHAANVMLLASGGTHRREAAIVDQIAAVRAAADPLPQAFVLTAIVITFGVVVFLVALAGAGGSDDTEPAGEDPEPGGGSATGGFDRDGGTETDAAADRAESFEHSEEVR